MVVLAEAVMGLQKRTLDCSLALTLLQFNWSILTTAIILNLLWKFSWHTCMEGKVASCARAQFLMQNSSVFSHYYFFFPIYCRCLNASRIHRQCLV